MPPGWKENMPGFVEKLLVPVRLCMAGQAPYDAHLSLFPLAESHAGPETLLERLNSPTRIVPAVRAEDQSVVLVTREQVDWVEAGHEVEAELIRPAAYLLTREEHVELHLASGERVSGVLAMELPDAYNRASDFLNGDDDFFAFATSSGTRLVNKARVLEVRILSARPAAMGKGPLAA